MSDVGFILDRLAARESAALFWREQAYSGSWICRQARRDLEYLQTEGVCAGATVLFEADYSARTVAMLLALAELRTILVPLLPATLADNFARENRVKTNAAITAIRQVFTSRLRLK